MTVGGFVSGREGSPRGNQGSWPDDKVLGLLLGLWPAVHFGLGADLALSYQEIVFTSQEQKWIRQHKTIRLGVDPDWPPIEFVGTEGGVPRRCF
jgi:hypothetical protein